MPASSRPTSLKLPFPDVSFDLVVCLETIEHLDAPEHALDELRRVLAGDGLLAALLAQPGPLPGGHPTTATSTCPRSSVRRSRRASSTSRLLRQQAWTTSMIQDDAASRRRLRVVDVDLRKVVGRRPGEETFTVALASDVDLPDVRGVAVVSAAEEYRRWVESSPSAADADRAGASDGLARRGGR